MVMHRRHFAAGLALAFTALTIAACQSTTLENSWRDPQYKGPPLKKILVVGVANQATTRRTFEDEFVKQLAAGGVTGAQSYNYMPQSGQVDEATVKQALQRAGADGVLVTRFVRAQVNTEVDPGFVAGPGYPAGAGMGFYGGYAGAWGGYYEPATVTQTVTLVLETRLYAVDDSTLLWSGTTDTFQPSDVQKDVAGFAEVIIAALKKQALI